MMGRPCHAIQRLPRPEVQSDTLISREAEDLLHFTALATLLKINPVELPVCSAKRLQDWMDAVREALRSSLPTGRAIWAILNRDAVLRKLLPDRISLSPILVGTGLLACRNESLDFSLIKRCFIS